MSSILEKINKIKKNKEKKKRKKKEKKEERRRGERSRVVSRTKGNRGGNGTGPDLRLP